MGADRRLALADIAVPEPGPDEVRVKVAACGLCGSDLHMRRSPILAEGAVMGHELSGTLDALGAGVTGWAAGDRVVVYPFPVMDQHDLSLALACLGYGSQGGFAEHVVIGADRLWRLPDAMSFELGALVEPLAVAVHGLNIAGVRTDDAVAVVGAGPIGVMAALALRGRGVERVVVVEPNQQRRDRMAAFGIPAVDSDGALGAVMAALGEQPRVVIECAGHPSAPGTALELVAVSGTVGLLGFLEEPISISQLIVMMKEATLTGSFAYRPKEFDEAIALLASGAVPGEQLITDRVPLDRAQDVIDELERPGTDHLKVLLIP